MSYSLVEAATACGVNRSIVLRAIRAGKISAGKDEQDEWRIEAVKLQPSKQPVVTIRHSFRHTHDAVLARLLSLLQEIGQERVIILGEVRGIPPVPR
jgi:hypothetical protein